MINKTFYIAIFTMLIVSPIVHAEHPDTTFSKLQKNKIFIESTSKICDISSRLLASIIYVERTQNYSWEDDALDNLLAEAGLNSSIGLCQVKLKTAYWIEVQLNDTTSKYFPGIKFFGKLNVSQNPEELINKLNNDSLNIHYAAAYLRIIISRWEKQDCPISKRVDIIGTLYSTGLFNRNGNERFPNKTPKANDFGRKVKKALELFKDF